MTLYFVTKFNFNKIPYLIEVKYKIEFTHVVEVFIEHFNKIVDSFKIAEVVVIHIHTYTEV